MAANLLAISQNELTEWIHLIIKDKGEFPRDFNWNSELLKKGYKPEFVNIDFVIIKQNLAAYKIPLGRRAGIWHGQYANMIFSGCKNLPLSTNRQFENCTFEKCTITNEINSDFSNCVFKEMIFDKASIISCKFTQTLIDNCKFINADLRNINSTENDLHITNSEILSSRFESVNGLVENEFASNRFDEKCTFQYTKWDSLYNDNFHINNTNPIVVMLFREGAVNAAKMVEFYKKYDINLILISPEKGITHPLFKTPELISGIILPGGPNVPLDDNDPRKKFEIELLNLACERKIPTLGICRGHQFIGSRFGGEIQNAIDHKKHTIFVKPKEDSLLYKRLAEKHQKFEEKKDPSDKTLLNKDEKGRYIYHSVCAHEQILIFKTPIDKSIVKVVAKAADGVPEALQINKHILTYQHHHEAYLDENPESGKVARALLKQFATMVKEYEKLNKDKKDESTSPNLLA